MCKTLFHCPLETHNVCKAAVQVDSLGAGGSEWEVGSGMGERRGDTTKFSGSGCSRTTADSNKLDGLIDVGGPFGDIDYVVK